MNNAAQSELDMQDFAAQAFSYDTRLSGFYAIYQSKFLTMDTRSYAAMRDHMLLHDSANPVSQPSVFHAKKQPTAAHARHAIDDDDDVNSDFEDGYDEGFAAGMTAANATTRTHNKGTSVDARFDPLESSIASLADAIKRLSSSGFKAKYCFHHGLQGHHGTSCTTMLKDPNFTVEMRNATKKCVLIANDGTSITGAD